MTANDGHRPTRQDTGASLTAARGSRRHKHVFSALWTHFGPYGRQDVHVHGCRPWDDDEHRCDRVLIGPGRECDGDVSTHWRETLTDE